MADKRAYFKLDVGYLTNPKVAAVSLESPTAVLLHIGSIAYAAQHLTDGEVPVALVLRLTGASKKDAEILRQFGLWQDSPNPGHALIHDYLKHQRSAVEVKGASDKAKQAAQARWDAECNAESNASSMPDANRPASESAMPREREREREENQPSATRSEPDLFDEFWTRYPRKVARGAAAKAWKAAVKKVDDPWEIINACRSWSVRVQGSDEKFIPHASTWLNAERWLDETPAAIAAEQPRLDEPFRPPECPPEIAEDGPRYLEWLRNEKAKWDARRTADQ